MQAVTILGSTGSIGVSTLDVLSRHPEQFQVFALSAHKQVELLAEQCRRFHPRYAVLSDEQEAVKLRELLDSSGLQTDVIYGANALADVASAPKVDIVMAAIVGAAGLVPTMAAVRSGKRVLLANKEALVMSGKLFTDAVRRYQAELLPVDSEHNAIFQCLPRQFSTLEAAGVEKLLLTGSGGPFRTRPLDSFGDITPEQAVAHPNWSMGQKISVDSATMMNKGLEYIEACWLFDANPEQIEVVVHPQSVVHSMVQYRDGSVVAQLGQPDMRTPIAHCLSWPESRITAGVEPLDFTQLSKLEFAAPDFDRFPCLRLAMEAMESGGDHPAALNAANEIAVEAFLNRQIAYRDIASVVSEVLSSWSASEPLAIDDVIEADSRARCSAREEIKKREVA
jgi:1-deoxy-D-xylulose-5-phosphate reductoisomerase